ncbi:NAD(P)-dependent alcohol dehydrogenase [Rhizobium leguminosarum]|uniref:NAD(P)-dependent alcohol dehydrogenase n=1 Tax=Rhizobium leguminosarum TaxID=384 RepID=UPI00098EB808|nr:NAD(P)-dependent alcohol dehydrogenase [Rhizobium leguminosarum]MBB5262383.1 aryl-alcohol dehydrogenase [Rhizobium leguminosarum]MDX6006737.1 NAD(P)-dependent alcohol dehydrogenase [Rhizobium leguminosarum]OOO45896.1 NAD(P)-dependent alcohol dehydrogenase [Rhizobium leguminosarum bv. viciae USDA 2370]PUB65753.1 NAD(P)-dependent alcohol dehydrogenase [Rhizobium leguminosarum bv. viciae USDA 2370]
MKIHAAVARAPHTPFSLERLDLEEPREGEILVRVVATGVCHTDIVMRDQHLPVPQPVVLGHEGAGIVERVGRGVAKVKPGDHVVMTFNSCGHCPSCNDHEETYCHEFFPRNFFGARADGSSGLSCEGERVHGNIFGQSSFASHALCHERNIVKVPEDADLALLGPLACGIQTGAGAVMNALKIEPGKVLAVFGMGSVGLAAVMAARIVGASRIIAVDVNETRLALAAELGATDIVNGRASDAVAAIMALTGAGVDYSIDASGVPAVIDQCVRVLAPRGTCGIVGASPHGATLTLELTHILSGGRRVRGIVEGDSNPDVLIPLLIDLHRQGRFPFDRLVTFYDFADINQAVEDSEKGIVLKPVVRQPAV